MESNQLFVVDENRFDAWENPTFLRDSYETLQVSLNDDASQSGRSSSPPSVATDIETVRFHTNDIFVHDDIERPASLESSLVSAYHAE